MQHGPTEKTCLLLLVSFQVSRQREILQGGRHGVMPIHHRSGKSKRKARSSLSAEVQALDDAEQELYFTRLQLVEFRGFTVNLSNVAETVQRVDGLLVMDAKAIYDSMYGASGPLAMEEKRTAIEMMGIQEGLKRQNAFLRWCHGEANLSDGLTKETTDQGNNQDAIRRCL